MPSTRRRFLAGATALCGALAGCNERSARAIEETVTPVDVPRSDESVLREATSIDAPSIPSAVVVTQAHHDAAVEHVDELRQSVTERLGSSDGSDDSGEIFRLPRSPEQALDRAEDQLRTALDAGPSEEALRALRRAVQELAPVEAYLRFEAGDLDVEAVHEDLEAERAATDELRERVDYRIAEPVGYHLPTAAAAERWLDALDGVHDAERSIEEVDDDHRAEHVADVYRNLERHRRRRDDAEWFLETATDPDAPSLRAAIDDELDAIDEELAAVAERVPESRDDQPDDETAIGEIRSIRRSVWERSRRFRDELADYREDGRRLRGLFEGVRRLVEFGSIDAAVERTVPLLREREFPSERLLGEKRDAVEALGRAADGTAVQRQFAATAPQLVDSADRYARSDGVDPRQLAQMHLLYVGAAEWTERGLSRGEALSESLQAQQS